MAQTSVKSRVPPEAGVMNERRGCPVLAGCLLITSLAVAAVGVPVRAACDVDVNAVDGLMLRLMSKYNVPGAALALIKDGHIALKKGFAFEIWRIAHRSPLGHSSTSARFRSPFTALGVAQLVDQHKSRSRCASHRVRAGFPAQRSAQDANSYVAAAAFSR